MVDDPDLGRLAGLLPQVQIQLVHLTPVIHRLAIELHLFNLKFLVSMLCKQLHQNQFLNLLQQCQKYSQ